MKGGEKVEEMIARLRNQAFWMSTIAEKLEKGESIEDYLWTVDETLIPELVKFETVEKESEAA